MPTRTIDGQRNLAIDPTETAEVSTMTPCNQSSKLHTLASLLALVLAACLSACGTTGPSTATPHATSTPPAPTPSPAGTPVPHYSWQTYTDSMFGFRMDLPASISFGHEGGGDGGHYEFYQGNVVVESTSTPGQLDWGIALLTISAQTKGPVSCYPGPVTALTVGANTPAKEIDQITATPGPDGTHEILHAYWVSNGIYILVTLDGPPPADSFVQRYSTTWHHILASFVPGAPVSNTSFSSLQDVHCS